MSQGNVEDRFENITELPVPKTDYFSELMKLRMRWKVKKSGNAITGDLSYKSGNCSRIRALVFRLFFRLAAFIIVSLLHMN